MPIYKISRNGEIGTKIFHDAKQAIRIANWIWSKHQGNVFVLEILNGNRKVYYRPSNY